MKTADVANVFAELKKTLVPLVQAIVKNKDAVDDSVLDQDFDEAAQWDFGLIPLQAIGFDMQRGRIRRMVDVMRNLAFDHAGQGRRYKPKILNIKKRTPQ